MDDLGQTLDQLNEQYTTRIEIITPSIAASMLENNTSNRPLSMSVVERYADDMKNQRWQINGESIIISDDNKLLNGQHRLNGIILSGTSIYTHVTRGLPEAVFKTMDSGKLRTAGDILAIEGVPNASLVAAASRLIMPYMYDMEFKNNLLSRKKITDFVELNPYVGELVTKVHSRTGPATVGPLAAILFLANRTRKFDLEVDAFVEYLHTGRDMQPGSPILTVREWLYKQRSNAYGRLPKEIVFIALARAWTGFMTNDKLTKMNMKDTNPANAKIFGFESPSLFKKKEK